jgi:excisionase family DNA binding protein
MLAPPNSPSESYRRAERRLRQLLFGDEGDVPSVLRGGEDARLRVLADLRHMRHAVEDLESALAAATAGEPASDDLVEELRHAASAWAEGHNPDDLLRPAEAALALGVSVSSVYRAVRVGALRAVRPTPKRGGMRIPTGEVRRLAGELTSRARETA